MGTVHVRDVCRAVWHLREVGEPGAVFNLADKGGSSQSQFQITGLWQHGNDT